MRLKLQLHSQEVGTRLDICVYTWCPQCCNHLHSCCKNTPHWCDSHTLATKIKILSWPQNNSNLHVLVSTKVRVFFFLYYCFITKYKRLQPIGVINETVKQLAPLLSRARKSFLILLFAFLRTHLLLNFIKSTLAAVIQKLCDKRISVT